MKTLFLVRHAKSSWDYNVTDHERPLNKRGFSDAQLISKYLKDKITIPDLVLSSDAVRAKTTASIFTFNLGIEDSKVDLVNDLYDFSGSQLTKIIKSCDKSINTLMIFGHNNAITFFANNFGSLYINNVPTCGFVHLKCDIDSWSRLTKGKTITTVFPKQLK